MSKLGYLDGLQGTRRECRTMSNDQRFEYATGYFEGLRERKVFHGKLIKERISGRIK